MRNGAAARQKEKPMKTLDSSPWQWTLYELPTGDWVLCVVCGTAGIFENHVALTFDERNEYAVTGKASLDCLAAEVRSNPAKFQDRQTSIPRT